jgi:prepilin-type N-terminal cleavage/methylation domain-containing protein
MNINKFKNKGFTLVEIAIVLVIVGLMLSAFLTPLRAQLSQRDNTETRGKLSDISEALLGYALNHSATLDSKPYLPCPDTDGDGAENRTANLCTNINGTLPYKDLGLVSTDSWERNFIYQVTQTFANSANGFAFGMNGGITVLDAAGGNALAINIPAIVISLGENGAVSPVVGADQTENTNGDVFFVSKSFTNTAANPFDDLVVWISPNVLMNRMVTAGKLP